MRPDTAGLSLPAFSSRMPAWIVLRDRPVALATRDTPPWGKAFASAAAQTRRPRSSNTSRSIRNFLRRVATSFPIGEEYIAFMKCTSYLCAYPYLVHGRVGVLHDMEFVIDDSAFGQPLLDTLPERIPHIYTGGLNRATLEGTQPLLKELIEGVFLSVLSEPHRLAGIKIAHHGDELLLLAQVNLVNAHVAQGGLLAAFRPTLKIAQIDGPHRVRRKPKLKRHAPRRCTLASQSHRILETLAERCFTRQQRNLLRLHAATRAAQTIQFNHHCSQILGPGKIAYFPLIGIGNSAHHLTAARTDQLLVSPLTTHPQLQPLC